MLQDEISTEVEKKKTYNKSLSDILLQIKQLCKEIHVHTDYKVKVHSQCFLFAYICGWSLTSQNYGYHDNKHWKWLIYEIRSNDFKFTVQSLTDETF